MTPDEKLEQLTNKYLKLLYGKKPFYKKSDYFKVRQVVLIVVDEQINTIQNIPDIQVVGNILIDHLKYWQTIKSKL